MAIQDYSRTSIQKKTMETIKGYKGFNKDMTCRGFQYKEGQEYDTNTAEVCESGFHFCEHPLDVLRYYPPATSIYHEVEGSGNMNKGNGKIACTHIKIGARMDIAGLVKAAISYVKSRCTNEHNAEPGRPATAGYRGAATAGYFGAATAGEGGAATSRGSAIVGENGIACVRGNDCRAKGGMGALLIIAEEYEGSYAVRDWKAVVVDGITIKADTWYRLNGKGELQEEQDNEQGHDKDNV